MKVDLTPVDMFMSTANGSNITIDELLKRLHSLADDCELYVSFNLSRRARIAVQLAGAPGS
jgi:hypothetical protein